jgi:hypothetical protein
MWLDLKETGYGNEDWILLAQDKALVNTVINLRVP